MFYHSLKFRKWLAFIGRKIGKPRGMERLARFLIPPVSLTSAQPERLQLGWMTMEVNPCSHVGWSLYCMGQYEPGVQSLIRRHVNLGAVCVDVGANNGWHTILMSKLVGKTGIVHAFEANPAVFRQLEVNLLLNDCKNVCAHETALSDRKGTAFFSAPSASHPDAGDGHLIASNEETASDVIEVPLQTMDDALRDLERLDFIKIDVEGWEPAVLEGATETIRRFRPAICLELLPIHLQRAGYSTDDLSRPLMLANYHLFGFSDRKKPFALTKADGYSGDILALPCS